MSQPDPRPGEALPTDEERDLLRKSVRACLDQHWPAATAVAAAHDPRNVGAVWRALAELGVASLGTDPGEGGLQEIVVVAQELGRAACPAPFIDAVLVNLALWSARGTNAAVRALLADLHAGKASVAFAFGVDDGDPGAGSATVSGGKAGGRLRFVEGARHCSHLVLLAEPGPVLAIVELGGPAVAIEDMPGYSVPPLAELTLEGAPAASVALDALAARDLHLVARMALAARALGAADRGFEMVTAYAKERFQFGQPIGRFQAIQHKLANCLMSLDGARLALGNAALNRDRGDAQWRVLGAAAHAFASAELRQVSLETHHTFGAIGYAEEHEAPRHFRRTHSDLVRLGGVRRSREDVARYLLDEGNTLPEYDLGSAGNAFRTEVRAWLAEYWTGERKARYDALPFKERGFDDEFSRAIGEKGWHTLSWPKEFGGQARTPLEQLAFFGEIYRAEAPRPGGCEIQAHAIMAFGTPEQKARYLPPMVRGEISFCLGYSEPGSGSDLASLKTRAVRDGDEWVINGQKIWTTIAERADYMWLAARTDPDAKPPHAGISVFIVPMNTPGLTLRPSMALYGHNFCNEFLDDVRVPADAVVGGVNNGWKVLTAALATERVMMGGMVTWVCANFDRLVAHLREARAGGAALKDDAVVRDRIGMLAAEAEVARQFLMHSVRMVEQGKVPVHEAAMSKAYTAEFMQRFGEAALDLAGMGVSLGEGAPGAITDGRIEQMLRQSIMMVVGGGTNEIQRNLIAQRGLGLPR
ncbi:MAG: acyl-CoA dehydrogenase family protein [Gammaproteobacteria bacterium]